MKDREWLDFDDAPRLTDEFFEEVDDYYVGNKRIRLAKYLFPALFELRMMTPSYIDGKELHHESELIEKTDQPPALA